MPPHIFEAGLRVDTNVYLAVLKDKVLSWIKEIVGMAARLCPLLHIQEEHGGAAEQLLQPLVTPDMWPPNSPDLN